MKSRASHGRWISAAGAAALLLLAAFVAGPGIPGAAGQAPAAKKKVLIVWGGWAGHEPKQCIDVFAPWLAEQGFDVEIANSLDAYNDGEKLKSLALIVQAVTMGAIKPEQER